MTAPDDDEVPTRDPSSSRLTRTSALPTRSQVFVGPVDEPDAYELIHPERALGGTEGTIWQAAYLGRFDRPLVYAIKRLCRPEGVDASWPEDRQRALWEDQVRLLKRVGHPNLVRYHSMFVGWDTHEAGAVSGAPATERTCFYLVMDWVDGRSLGELIKLGEGALATRLSWITQIASAVDHLHSGAQTGGTALFHHDIKPANIIVNALNGAVLVDCGLLRYEGANSPALGMYTPAYFDPWAHDPQGHRGANDLYALAATAYHAITGQTPQPHDPAAMRSEVVAATAHQVSDPNKLAYCLMTVLGNPPQKRPVSATWWANSLREAATTETTEADTRPKWTPPEPPRNHRSKLLNAVSAAAAIALVAGIVGAAALSGGLGGGGGGGGSPTATTDPRPAISAPPTTSTSGNRAVAAGRSKPLTDLVAVGSPPDVNGATAAMGGTSFLNSIGMNLLEHTPAQLVYDLGGTYSRLRAKVGLDDGVDCGAHVQVFADDKAVFDQTVRTGPPADLDVSLSGVAQLRLVVLLNQCNHWSAEFADATLSSGGSGGPPVTVAPTLTGKRLQDLVAVGSPPDVNGATAAMGGTSFLNSIGMNLLEHTPAQLVYDIGGTYSRLRAKVGLDDGVDCAAHVQVFADDKAVFDQTVRTGSPAELDVSLSGVAQLRLVVLLNQCNHWSAEFADARLT